MYCTVLRFLQVKYDLVKPTTMTKKDAATMGIPYPNKPGWLAEHGHQEVSKGQVETMISNLANSSKFKTSEQQIKIVSSQLARLVREWPDLMIEQNQEPVATNASSITKKKGKKGKRKNAMSELTIKIRADMEKQLGRPLSNPVEIPYVPKTAKAKPEPKKSYAYDGFYETREWRELRYKALVKHGAACQCCGATRSDGIKLHVDHIKPRSKFPSLQLELSNLQILCEDCNLGKSNKDQTDWRETSSTSANKLNHPRPRP